MRTRPCQIAVLVTICIAVAVPRAVADVPTPQRSDLAVGRPTEAHVYWMNTIQMVPDPTRDGMPGPGLVGRMFLFSSDGKPITCDGTVMVKLYNEQPADGSIGHEIERWIIDKANLAKMIEKDIVGYGYTMYLPTDTCNSRVTKVHMNVTFTPEKGNPLYSISESMRLSYPEQRRRR
jgi:hypothetical protein